MSCRNLWTFLWHAVTQIKRFGAVIEPTEYFSKNYRSFILLLVFIFSVFIYLQKYLSTLSSRCSSYCRKLLCFSYQLSVQIRRYYSHFFSIIVWFFFFLFRCSRFQAFGCPPRACWGRCGRVPAPLGTQRPSTSTDHFQSYPFRVFPYINNLPFYIPYSCLIVIFLLTR